MSPWDEAAARLLPGARAGAPRLLEGGVSAAVHALDLVVDGEVARTVVLRRNRDCDWKPADPKVAPMEHGLLRMAHRAGLPVPEPLGLFEAGDPFPTACVAMAFVDAAPDLRPDLSDDQLVQVADVLAALHALDPSGAPALPTREDPILELPRFWPVADWPAGLEGALEAQRVPTDTCVLHGDYWPGNWLWRDRRLLAVIDWEDAACGDPLSDLAGSRLELAVHCGPEAADRFTDRYLGRSRRTRGGLLPWELFVSSAALASMDHWGLPEDRLAFLRRGAEAFRERVLHDLTS